MWESQENGLIQLTFPATVGGGTVDPNTVGMYVATYGATDTAGNAATQVTRKVHVVSASRVAVTKR